LKSNSIDKDKDSDPEVDDEIQRLKLMNMEMKSETGTGIRSEVETIIKKEAGSVGPGTRDGIEMEVLVPDNGIHTGRKFKKLLALHAGFDTTLSEKIIDTSVLDSIHSTVEELTLSCATLSGMY